MLIWRKVIQDFDHLSSQARALAKHVIDFQTQPKELYIHYSEIMLHYRFETFS